MHYDIVTFECDVEYHNIETVTIYTVVLYNAVVYFIRGVVYWHGVCCMVRYHRIIVKIIHKEIKIKIENFYFAESKLVVFNRLDFLVSLFNDRS